MRLVSNEPRSEPSGVLYGAEHGRLSSRYKFSVCSSNRVMEVEVGVEVEGG